MQYEQGAGTKTCADCGEEFVPKYDYSTLCWPCFWASPKGQAYKAKQGQGAEQKDQYQEANANFARQRAERERQQEETRRQRQQQTHDDWFKRYQQEYGGQKSSQQSNTAVALDKGFLRKLLMLCHPDKHDGSELSNAVTIELLRMKKELE